jgi:nucleotide-binding universal stress UspA family protein
MERIVVGIDGTPEAQHALRWAVDEASNRPDAVVEAVHAWLHPEPCRKATFNMPHELGEHDAAALLGRTLEQVRAETHTHVPIDACVVEDEPVHALLERASGAALVVVGRTRRTRVGRWLHQSVAREVADRAPCPVTVVTPGDTW